MRMMSLLPRSPFSPSVRKANPPSARTSTAHQTLDGDRFVLSHPAQKAGHSARFAGDTKKSVATTASGSDTFTQAIKKEEALVRAAQTPHPKTRQPWLSEALCRAAASGAQQSVMKMLRMGADSNYQNVEGETALMIATRNGHTNLAQQLLAFQAANPDLKNEAGKTAVDQEKEANLDKIVALFQQSAAPKGEDPPQESPASR